MNSIPLPIITIRTNACIGESGMGPCDEFVGPWTCRRIGSLRQALTLSQEGLCPLGRHPHAKTRVAGSPSALRDRWIAIRSRLATGVRGWLMYLTRRCPAPVGIVRFRRSQCGPCEHRRKALGLLSTCGLCGCVLRIKTAIADSECPAPAKLWASLSTKKMKTPCRGLDTLPLVGRFFKSAKGCGCNKTNG